MRKIIIATLAISFFLSTFCFGQQAEPQNEKLARKIANSMIKSKELDDYCVKESKNNSNEMITVTEKKFSIPSSNVRAFLVAGNSPFCCMGARRRNLWIYKKDQTGEGFSLLLGPVQPDEIKISENDHTNGMYEIEVVQPADRFNPTISEFYEFNGKKYELVGKRINE